MTNEEKAKIVREAFEKFPMKIYPNTIDSRFPMDVNRKERNAWLSVKLGEKVT